MPLVSGAHSTSPCDTTPHVGHAPVLPAVLHSLGMHCQQRHDNACLWHTTHVFQKRAGMFTVDGHLG
jgi:hypothetical protein